MMALWQKRVRLYNRRGYRYLGLFFAGGGFGEMYSEWEKPDGKIIKLYYNK